MDEPPAPSRSYHYTLHKQGSPLQSSAKTIVMNVLCKCKESYPKDSDNDNMKKTSYLTGVSRASILRMIREYREKGSFATASKKQTGCKRITRLEKYDASTLSGIRQKVDVYLKRNEFFTFTQIMKDINEDPLLPNLSKRTTQRLLKDLGISLKRSRKSMQPVNLRSVKKTK